jgi:hypothetical protein
MALHFNPFDAGSCGFFHFPETGFGMVLDEGVNG